MANFKYVETIATGEKLLDELKAQVTGFGQYEYNSSVGESAVDNTWQVFSELKNANGNIMEMVLKGRIVGGGATPQVKDFYVKLINHSINPQNTALTYKEHSTLTVQILDDLDTSVATPEFKLKGHPVRYQWAKEDYTPTDRNERKPIYMYLNVMNNRLTMVLVADPAVNLNDYKKSFLYVGSLKPFKYNETDDVQGNVMLTAGCLLAEPSITQIASDKTYYFGEYTSPGNNTLQMLKTKSGIEFQKHYPAFITQAPGKGNAYIDPVLGDTGLDIDPQGFQASKWTNRYHLSPIYVVHPFEGYRGQFEGVIGVTKHNILHLDELIVDVEGKTWKQEVYRYFDTNTEQTFMNQSANQKMGVAILKEVRY